jgi:hypothetical protein
MAERPIALSPVRCGVSVVPIRLLISDHAFPPEDARVLAQAFEDTLKALRLVDRDDPATMLVARIIIDLAKAGERDPFKLRSGALLAINGLPAE